MDQIDILTIDDRGRIVIPRNVRKILDLDKNDKIIALGDEDRQEILLFPYFKEKKLVTLLIESKELPRNYKESIQNVIEDLWGRKSVLLHSKIQNGDSLDDVGIESNGNMQNLKNKIHPGQLVKVIALDDVGRLLLPKPFRYILQLTADSYIISLASNSSKFVTFQPFLRTKDMITVRISNEDHIEWRVFRCRPEEISQIQSDLKKQYPQYTIDIYF